MERKNSNPESLKDLQQNTHVDYLKVAREKLRSELFVKILSAPNRLELTNTINDVKYYNDSAAVCVDDTAVSIGVLESGIVLILGPYAKNTDYNSIREISKGRVDAIICFGDQRENVMDFFLKESWLLINAEDLEEAVYFAKLYASPINKVLFSSASPSFPAYASVVDRADNFLEAINKIQTT